MSISFSVLSLLVHMLVLYGYLDIFHEVSLILLYLKLSKIHSVFVLLTGKHMPDIVKMVLFTIADLVFNCSCIFFAIKKKCCKALVFPDISVCLFSLVSSKCRIHYERHFNYLVSVCLYPFVVILTAIPYR